MNVWVFSGRLGGDAEQRFTKAGTEVCQFSVATEAGYGERKSTTWARCTLFGKRGDALMPYLVKGQQVVVSGELALREWDNRDGVTKSSLEVKVNNVTLVGGKPAQTEQSPQAAAQPVSDFDDGIPF